MEGMDMMITEMLDVLLDMAKKDPALKEKLLGTSSSRL
jgi:hypothetical protein